MFSNDNPLFDKYWFLQGDKLISESLKYVSILSDDIQMKTWKALFIFIILDFIFSSRTFVQTRALVQIKTYGHLNIVWDYYSEKNTLSCNHGIN